MIPSFSMIKLKRNFLIVINIHKAKSVSFFVWMNLVGFWLQQYLVLKSIIFNNSYRTHPMHLGNPNHDIQIDRLLKIQYHDICFNPAKRQALQRLTSSPPIHHHPFNFSQDGLKDAVLLHKYIKQVYERYGIEDPIRKELRLAGRNTENYTPEKGLNGASIIQGDRLTRTKKKLLNMKDSFKRDSEEVIYTSQFSNNQPYLEGQSSINTTRINREIGYRTKQKIRFKTVTSEEAQRSLVLQQFAFGTNQPQNNRTAWKGQTRSYGRQKPRQLMERIAYCPICEEMYFQQNMTQHQSQCSQWISSQQISKKQFQSLIVGKIKRMQRQICDELQDKDGQNIISQFGDIKCSIKAWMEDGRSSFTHIKQKFQQFSVNLLQKVRKLNWFRGYQEQFQSDNKLRK